LIRWQSDIAGMGPEGFFGQTRFSSSARFFLGGIGFAEKDGTFSNKEGRVMRVRQTIAPVEDSRPNWQVIGLLPHFQSAPLFLIV
jgi:predicted molibdopterin-dependent oxidoreductase YjgC